MLQVTRAPSRTKRACEAVAVLLTACLTTSVFAAPRMAADPETRPLTFNRKGRNNTIWAFGRKSDGYVANACLQLLPWPCVLTVLFFWIMTTSCLSDENGVFPTRMGSSQKVCSLPALRNDFAARCKVKYLHCSGLTPRMTRLNGRRCAYCR